MKSVFLLFLVLLLPLSANAGFIINYGLNYSSQKDASDTDEYDQQRTFHKILLGASVNQRKTLYFGWNINSWSSSLKQDNSETTYSLLEMGPRLLWFTNENYNLFLTAEWNPYAQGDREKSAQSREIQGSSMSVGIGYRFRLSRAVGLGASINYHSLSLKEEKIDSITSNVSDKVSNIMPMLEFSIITK